MQVAIDGRSVVRERTGIGEYTRELVRSLLRVTDEHQFLILGSEVAARGSIGSHERLRYERAQSASAPRLRRAYWENVTLPRLLTRQHVDVFHNPAPLLPIRPPGCATVVTVPDTTPFDAPRWYGPLTGRGYRLRARRSIEMADVVIAISDAVRTDVARLFRVDPNRLVTIHLAASSRFGLDRDPVAAARLRKTIPAEFILCVGGLEPRKNQVRLIQAFDAIADRFPTIHLVLAGRRGWLNDDTHLAARSSNSRDRIRFIEYVSDEDLPELYRLATLLAYPSLSEGFGLPVVEAMASGLPVLTSNRSALPEVAGGAALLVNPESVDSIAAGLRKLLADGTLRRDLARRGLLRSASFDWDFTAKRTLEAYELAIWRFRLRDRRSA